MGTFQKNEYVTGMITEKLLRVKSVMLLVAEYNAPMPKETASIWSPRGTSDTPTLKPVAVFEIDSPVDGHQSANLWISLLRISSR